MSQQLREQTEECQRLEAALNETCICLAKALRSILTPGTRLGGKHSCIGFNGSVRVLRSQRS